MASTPSKRALPSKESSLFKELLTFYETRQLKKGQKTADQILKKFPEHGETLCMKGLILTHMGKRDEGRELVKKGVRLDLTSHIVWHVFGLIQKGEKNYEEALKSYTQALRFDKENMNILRDAAHLQTQLRLYDGLVETRHLLLKLRPNLRQNWIGLAIAYHLNGNLTEVKRVLEQYERTLKNVPDYDVEQSELMLYHVRVLEDLGELSEALSLLDVNAKSRVIVDRVAIMETRARILSKQGPTEETEQSWRALIQHNPDCPDYYKGLLASKGIDLDNITDSNRAEALQILRDLSTQLPRADTPRRLALDVSIGDEFQELVRDYLLRGLKKGIPSLFVDVKTLYKDTPKWMTIEELVEGFRETQENGGSLDDPSIPSAHSSPPSTSHEAPTTYLWTLYFLAQHHSSRDNHFRALTLITTALTHTPTLPELLTFKGRILKRLGDPVEASVAVNEARLLDGQDRFLNTKAAKYKLRAGLIEDASDILGLFTKKDAPSPGADLEDMQSLLYLMEEGNAYRRKGRLHQALKKYHVVRKVFEEFEDDQYDFHGYSLRKSTLNIYLNLIAWEDNLWSHPAYVASAIAASQIYVKVHDDPSVSKDALSSGTSTEAEKKAKKKAKKAAQKIQEELKKAASTSTNEDKGLEVTPPKDEDPDGFKLLTDPEPLERAWKLLSPLPALVRNNIDVWIAVYDVAVRRGKYLQAVRALSNAKALDPEHAELHLRYLHFRKTYSALPSPLSGPVGAIVSNTLSSLLPSELSSDLYNSQYLQRHPADARAVFSAARGLHLLDHPKEEVEDMIFGVLNREAHLQLKVALEVLAFLQGIRSARAEEFRLACDQKFLLSSVFKNPAELALLQREGSPKEEQQEVIG
ncbi:N-terminal acetyltransferase A auxiliary subunit [Artomyces pyxidatus]|uniref:N-terminal acetyltransferase A auxiliary subunit n=1 Tax=Artomyces pyxidatus TaxID=48021 RepID=A0ACB8T9N9_9AGAM|nr:N-terminal acetyltransferase A auxiliary subunit [Artomyces pyxidatus]